MVFDKISDIYHTVNSRGSFILSKNPIWTAFFRQKIEVLFRPKTAAKKIIFFFENKFEKKIQKNSAVLGANKTSKNFFKFFYEKKPAKREEF